MNKLNPSFPIEVAQWRKNANEIICATLDSYKSTPTFNARVFYEEAPGQWKPTKKGLTVSVQHLPALREAVEHAEGAARQLGLLK